MSTDEKRYWQSVEEFYRPAENTPSEGELPEDLIEENTADTELGTSELGSNRRDFLKLMGLTFTAGIASSACSMPVQKAIPFLNQPEELTPGVANWYASSCGGCSAGCGILVKQRDGRPIKIEGNPDHPGNKGGICAIGQATVLSLYDAKRLKDPYAHGKPSSWETVDAEIKAKLADLATNAPAMPIVILSSTLTSPSTLALIRDFTQFYPSARHVTYDPVSVYAIRAAHRELTGNAVLPSYQFDAAKVIVGLDADFLGTWISPVEFTKHYRQTRNLAGATMPAYHVQIESGMSITGAAADQRIAANASERSAIALWIYEQLFIKANPAARLRVMVPEAPANPELLGAVVDALWANRGRSLVVSGANDIDEQITVAQINTLLANYGRTLSLTRPSLQKRGDDMALSQLLGDMNAKRVGALLMVNCNPVVELPMGKDFAEAMKGMDLTVSFSGNMDESASQAHYVLPDHFFLESWGDANPRVGLYSIVQPTITPLANTRALSESLLRLMHKNDSALDYLQSYWQSAIFPRQSKFLSFQEFWLDALQRGVVVTGEQSSVPAPSASGVPKQSVMAIIKQWKDGRAAQAAGTFDLALYQSIALQEGTYAGNPWLQELPDPITRTSWGNAIAMAPHTASRLDIRHGDIVELKTGNATATAAVYIQPGQATNTLSFAVGHGRACGDKVYGHNAYPLVRLQNGILTYTTSGVTVAKTAGHSKFAAIQQHHSMEGRPIALDTTLAEYSRDPHAGQQGEHPELVSLWERHDKTGHFWGMAIDLNACTGCGACVVACQAENNIPVVGEKEMRRSRDMHWLRIDRYYSGTPDAPKTIFQPMLCQHCENAPCETVCPVLATVHSTEGLNQQIYNRCVGTRYCANNCPYKVRRFNWFNYAKDDILDDPISRMVLNPDVTVRSRGVMEKCTFCVQRIQAGKLAAKTQGRPVRDGDIKTACEQSCPADAIVFGDMNSPTSRVAALKKTPRNYRVLDDLGTRPVVSYLTKVRNPLES